MFYAFSEAEVTGESDCIQPISRFLTKLHGYTTGMGQRNVKISVTLNLFSNRSLNVGLSNVWQN